MIDSLGRWALAGRAASGAQGRRRDGTVIIDAHPHLFWDQAENEAFLAECRRAGIDRVCAFLSSMCSKGRLADDPNRVALELRDRHPDRVIPFARLHPDDGPAAVDELTRCVEDHGMRGLKVSIGVKANDPRMFPIVEKCVELRIPLFCHTHMDRERRPERRATREGETSARDLAELAGRYPESMLIMAHYNLGDWEYGLKAVRTRPNIYPCVSGSGVDAGSIEAGVREVGAERLIFGTDNLIYECLGKVLGARVSGQDRERILGGNLLNLLTRRGALE